MRPLAPTACLVALLAGVALGADDGARRAAVERASALVARALDALRAQRGDEATQLLARARSTAPGEPVIAYDHALALAATGAVDASRDAYREALRQGESSVDEVAVRARHNLALSHLEAARAVEALLRTPGALEDAVRAHGAPGGEPLTPSTVTMLASQLRDKAIDDGLTNARGAIEVLRDTVRTNPAAGDAVRNLVLAQRARRFLEQERKKQDEQQSDKQDEGDEKPDEGKKDDQQDGQGSQGENDEQGQDEQQKPSAGDEDRQDGRQQAGQDGASADSEDAASETREGAPRDLDREEAERRLDQLLDAASLKARQVERMRAERLRRGAVEKDW